MSGPYNAKLNSKEKRKKEIDLPEKCPVVCVDLLDVLVLVVE